jgi:hypothetical protein
MIKAPTSMYLGLGDEFCIAKRINLSFHAAASLEGWIFQAAFLEDLNFQAAY